MKDRDPNPNAVQGDEMALFLFSFQMIGAGLVVEAEYIRTSTMRTFASYYYEDDERGVGKILFSRSPPFDAFFLGGRALF
jgi:hypothetical protein